jgi:hypothetical protein
VPAKWHSCQCRVTWHGALQWGRQHEKNESTVTVNLPIRISTCPCVRFAEILWLAKNVTYLPTIYSSFVDLRKVRMWIVKSIILLWGTVAGDTTVFLQ